jgi:hypothetical protein
VAHRTRVQKQLPFRSERKGLGSVLAFFALGRASTPPAGLPAVGPAHSRGEGAKLRHVGIMHCDGLGSQATSTKAETSVTVHPARVDHY